MGRVFETAQRGFACVGPYSEDNRAFMDILRAWPESTENFNDVLSEECFQETEQQLAQHIKKRLFWEDREIEWYEFCIAATNFFCRAYWHRLWIIQEITLAREITLICGVDCIDWTSCSVQGVAEYVFAKIYWDSISGLAGSELTERRRLDSIRNIEEILLTRHRRGPFKSPNHRTNLTTVLERFRYVPCADPLDRIYGFLHLIAEAYPMEKQLVPDYKQSPLCLALRCLSLLCYDSRGADLTDDFDVFLSSIGRLLEALELDIQQSEAWRLVQTRQQYFSDLCALERASNDMHFENSIHDAWRIAGLKEEAADEYCILTTRRYLHILLEQSDNGDLTADCKFSTREITNFTPCDTSALSRSEQYASTGRAPVGFKPKILRGCENSASLICGRAQTGDYCVLFEPFISQHVNEYPFEPCLVVHRCGSSRMFEIVEQGNLHFATALPPPSQDISPLTFYFSKQDLLAFAALEFWESDTNKEGWHDPNGGVT